MKYVVGLLMVLLTGCASVKDYQVAGEGEAFNRNNLRLTVPAGWMRAPDFPGMRIASIANRFVRVNSPSAAVEAEHIWALALETDLGRRHKALMPKEWAEYVLSRKVRQLATRNGVITESDMETLLWSGVPGFKLTINYTTAAGLDSRMVVYGAEFERDLYMITLDADLVENFDKMLPQFESFVKSARFKVQYCVGGSACF